MAEEDTKVAAQATPRDYTDRPWAISAAASGTDYSAVLQVPGNWDEIVAVLFDAKATSVEIKANGHTVLFGAVFPANASLGVRLPIDRGMNATNEFLITATVGSGVTVIAQLMLRRYRRALK